MPVSERGEVMKAGCVVLNNGQVLLIAYKDGSPHSFPKGHVEEGETLEQAAVRETREETGYVVEITGRLPDTTYTNARTGEPIRVAMFSARLTGRTQESGDQSWEWVDIEKAAPLLYPNLVYLLG